MEKAIANNRKCIKKTDRLIERICQDNINCKKTVADDALFTLIELFNVPEAEELRSFITELFERSAQENGAARHGLHRSLKYLYAEHPPAFFLALISSCISAYRLRSS
jgi:hypothetical protein